jgi:hypothetical protein
LTAGNERRLVHDPVYLSTEREDADVPISSGHDDKVGRCARMRQGSRMTREQSQTLMVGDRVFWAEDLTDQGVITEKNWAGVNIKWDNRNEQTVLHNDITTIFLASRI